MSGNSSSVSMILCSDGLVLPCWRPLEDVALIDKVGRGLVYFLAMAYLFIGVSIISDRFMAAIEVITSQEREVTIKKQSGDRQIIVVRMWNETVANLTLMALGSSAPEILLSVIEIYAKNFEAGELGPGTIVGSAAYNLFVIIAICVYVIPDGEVRKIKHLGVFFVTATWSIFAYVWLYVILAVTSPGLVDIWEALLTFFFFPLTVLTAYAADRKIHKYIRKDYRMNRRGVIVQAEGDGMELGSAELLGDDVHDDIKHEYITTLKELRQQHPHADLPSLERMAHEMVLNRGPKSRAFYRIQATRKLMGSGDLLRRISERAQSDLSEIKAEIQRESGAAEYHSTASRVFFEPAKYTVLESCGRFEVRVARTGDYDTPITVDYTTEDGTAQASSDYVPAKGQLHFAPGDKEKRLTLEVIDDDVFEADEHFYVKLSGARPMGALGSPTVATIIILDDDHGGLFKFEAQNYELVESVGTFDLKVVRCSGARGRVVVPYWTEDGTAKAGKEYEPTQGEVMFENNESEMQPSKSDPTFVCTSGQSCYHKAAWKFQLDHHIQRKHKNVYAAELFHAGIDPEEYSCVRCDFKSDYKLDRDVVHNRSHHDATRNAEETDIDIERGRFRCNEESEKYYVCGYCKSESHSSLSFFKYHDSCGMAEEVALEVPAAADDNLPSTTRMKNCSTIHMQTHARANKINWKYCDKCTYRAKLKVTLRRHMLTHATADEINWKYGGKCSSRAKLKCHSKEHMLTHDTVDQINWKYCDKCCYRTKCKSNLKRHMLTHATADEINWKYCDKCTYRAKLKGKLKQHMLTHATADEIDWKYCDKCTYRAKLKVNLRWHMLTHATADEINWKYCGKCSYRAKSKGNLKRHMLTHATAHEVNWYKCEKCSFCAKSKGEVKNHMLTHATADEINWKYCDKCTYRAKSNSDLKKHMLIHATADEINWKYCGKCSYRAKSKGNLKRHMLTHATAHEVNWYKCEKCSFCAKSKGEVKNHMLTHATADEINWKYCDKCTYRAKLNSDLKKHMLIHATADEINWKYCGKCTYRAKLKGTLRRHMLTHATADKIS